MNTFPETQQNLEQPQQANQLPHSQKAIAQPKQPTNTTEVAIAPLLHPPDITTLAQTGGIAAAIILSIAVVILALAEYNKSLRQ